MDRGWMYGDHRSLEFVNGVDSFVKAAKLYITTNPRDDGFVYCPCIDCKNQKQFANVEQIRIHLLERGFKEHYTCWNMHGEVGENLPGAAQPTIEATNVTEGLVHDSYNTLVDDYDVEDDLDQMLRDGEGEFLDERHLQKLGKIKTCCANVSLLLL
ncbi:hypothetical protein ACP70R_033238 [Stipagrostis hirtigluma subsp. patula]